MKSHLLTFVAVLLFLRYQYSNATLKALVQSRVGLLKDDQASDIFLLMIHLFRSYTPKCLRAVVVDNDIESTFYTDALQSLDYKKYVQQGKDNMDITKVSATAPLNTMIIINNNRHNQAVATINYINEETARVTSFACVSYLLSGPPDTRLLPLMTDPSSSKKLTRYFLIYAKKSTEAEQLLLDERMQNEENVAALVQEESQTKNYWRVLIRQLLHPSGSPQVLTVNRWSRDAGLASTKNIFPEQMADFYGKRLRGVSLDHKPLVAYEEYEGTLIVRPKPSIDVYILNVIAGKLNFTYDLAKPADGQWGYLQDGHWVGVVGEVQDSKANFSLVLGMMLSRAQAIDFTRMYFRDPMTFLTAKSPPSSPWKKLITPFRVNVWLCVLVSVGGGSVLYHVIYYAQATLASSHVRSSRAFMHVLGSFLRQSLATIPWLTGGRVFLGTWLLYGFLVTTYYKTSLTSTLAVPFAPPSIDTLDELLRSSLTFGINAKKGFPFQLFSSSKIPLYQGMFQSMSFYSPTKSICRVAEGSYAFISFKSYLTLEMVLHNSNPRRDTDLQVATEEFFPGGYAWAFPKGSPYRRPFDRVMGRCMQFGLLTKWLADLYPIYLKEIQEQNAKKQNKQVEEEDVPKTDDRLVVLNLNHLQGAFYILFLGVGSGGLLLIIELLLAWLWYKDI